MAKWQGFSERLQTPSELLDKLRHDLKRVERDPHDVWAAFDFFVTAETIVDWVWPTDTKAQKAERAADPMATVSHLASGAKHFRAENPKHVSVRDVRTRRGIFQPDVFDPRIFDTGGLVVDLRDGSSVSVKVLARRTLARCEELVVK